MAYEKIWDELSEVDQKVLIAMKQLLGSSEEQYIRVEDIRNAVKMTSNTFTTYRARLLESGVIDGKRYGYLSLKLPLFGRFVDMMSKY